MTPVKEALRTDNARAAFAWLMRNNSTYRFYAEKHERLVQTSEGSGHKWRIIRTAELLLHSPGLEVAARPWLYPRPSFGDTDVRERHLELGTIGPRSTPSLKKAWMRKVMSRCLDYEEDHDLHAFLYDCYMARRITSVVAMADKQRIAPDRAASKMQNFEEFWHTERAKLEDMCRQMRGLPNLFLTIAPAEWRVQHHRGLQHWRKVHNKLSEGAPLMTLHLHRTIGEFLAKVLLRRGARDESDPGRKAGLEEVFEYSLRYEFQDRGTLHVHVVAWVRFDDAVCGFEGPRRLSGRSGDDADTKSPLLALLENVFHSRVDVQAGGGSTCLLRYVSGYVSKASDSLHFKGVSDSESAGSNWRTTYRLLTKKAPLLPEIVLDFAALPLMSCSWAGAEIFAPVPGSMAANHSALLYRVYQEMQVVAATRNPDHAEAYIEWARKWDIEVTRAGGPGTEPTVRLKKRGGHKAGIAGPPGRTAAMVRNVSGCAMCRDSVKC